MSKDTNTMDLPVATVAGWTGETDKTRHAVSTVIDLKARRQFGRSRGEAQPTSESPDPVSPGEVWDALNDNRIEVHYQPQYDLRIGKIVAAEALLRLIDTDGQLVYPDRFIGTVEQRDLIVPLGRAVIERVCYDLAACRSAGLPIQRIAVNLSAYQLVSDSGILDFVDRTLPRFGLKYADLEFELTERQSLQSQQEGPDVLKALARRGAGIVIDDFGVGYSSVAYLAELPVSAFKLDRGLVARMLVDEPARALVGGLLGLARMMGLRVVAEGVESKAQGDYLAAAGCPLAQGHGFARPMPIEELNELFGVASTLRRYSKMGA